MTKAVILCVDGGGSTGRAALFDCSGNCILSCLKKGLNPAFLSDSEFEHRFAALVSPLIGWLDFRPQIIRAKVTLAGIGEPEVCARARMMIRRILKRFSKNVRLSLQTDVSLFVESLIEDEGIVLLAGTGSICVGVGKRKTVRIGGWGFLFDMGAGFEIGMKAIRMHLLLSGRQGGITWLSESLKTQSTRKLLRLGLPEICEKIAGFAKVVVEAYERGDPLATKIVEEASRGLVEMIESCWREAQLKGRRPVFVAGGLMKNASFLKLFTDMLVSKLPDAQVIPVKRSPLELMLEIEGVLSRQ